VFRIDFLHTDKIIHCLYQEFCFGIFLNFKISFLDFFKNELCVACPTLGVFAQSLEFKVYSRGIIGKCFDSALPHKMASPLNFSTTMIGMVEMLRKTHK
jgi:hypothetical protein